MSFIKAIKRPFRKARNARLRHEHKVRTKRHIVPHTNCHNCGQELHGIYCHNCGQCARDISPTVVSFVGQYFENSFQWDGKFFRTIRTLFAHPGRLSVAWAQGHVARYVFPLKLYMFVMVVFGLVAITALNHNSESIDKKSPEMAVADSAIVVQIEQSKVLDSVSYARVEYLLNSDAEIVNNPDKLIFNSSINMLSRLPIIFMFAMPIFALVTMGMFKRRYKKYIPHLVFAIHIHTLLFIVATVEMILRACFDIPLVATWVTIVGSYVYTVFAARVFFGGRWIWTSLKTFGVMFLYVIFCLIVLMVGFFANLYYDSLISGVSLTQFFGA